MTSSTQVTRHLSEIWSTGWLVDNFGQILGAIIATGLAYWIGHKQALRQIELAQLPEKIRNARNEKLFLEKLQNKLNDIGFIIKDRPFELYPETMLKLEKWSEKWWKTLENSSLAQKLDETLESIRVFYLRKNEYQGDKSFKNKESFENGRIEAIEAIDLLFKEDFFFEMKRVSETLGLKNMYTEIDDPKNLK